MENYVLNVSGTKNKVEFVPDGYALGNMGVWNQNEATIFINDGLNDLLKYQTILHEMLHVFFNAAGLRDGDDEERIVNGLSVQLYDFLVSNNGFLVDLINNFAKNKNNC